MIGVARWADVCATEPTFAEHVRRAFDRGRHKTLATVRLDGSPRISGIEVDFEEGDAWFGVMADSVKATDLRRDARLAIHSPTIDPPQDDPGGWAGEAKLAGRAVEGPADPASTASGRLRIDLTEVVLTRIGDPADHLVIESWHPGRGLERTERR
jgi:hypothetical protein